LIASQKSVVLLVTVNHVVPLTLIKQATMELKNLCSLQCGWTTDELGDPPTLLGTEIQLPWQGEALALKQCHLSKHQYRFSDDAAEGTAS
jgi:hypothetical protein